MAKFILRRLAVAVPIVLLISIIVFALMRAAPYDAVDAMTTPRMSEETIAAIKAKYGYDQPVYVQYFGWLEDVLQFNFGNSIVTKQPIAQQLSVLIPHTMMLVLPSYLTAYILAIVLGLIAGSHRGGKLDHIIDGIASVLIAVPTFWLAMLLIFVFGYTLRALPFIGMQTVGDGSPLDILRHFTLPYITLTIAFLPDNLRYVRSSTITQTTQDYVQVQEAFGAKKVEIMFKHICRNVLGPVLTRLGMAVPLLVTGAIITESIFSWPGVGPYFINAIKGLDYPIVMAILLLSSTLTILGNLLADVLCAIADPRIRQGVR
ncbi:MAG: ABC transporter permease [Coriobacteriales bacterium]|nr:ABC transporter permease [Coriobacteriales bacterium]